MGLLSEKQCILNASVDIEYNLFLPNPLCLLSSPVGVNLMTNSDTADRADVGDAANTLEMDTERNKEPHNRRSYFDTAPDAAAAAAAAGNDVVLRRRCGRLK